MQLNPPASRLPPAPPPAPAAGVAARERRDSAAADLLLVCVAVYVATAVGRVQRALPVLSHSGPRSFPPVFATALYLLQRRGA